MQEGLTVENTTRKKDREKIKQHPAFKDLDICDTWFEDIWRLEEEINDKKKYLRRVKHERKKQPAINTISIIGNHEALTPPGYQIVISESGEILFCKD